MSYLTCMTTGDIVDVESDDVIIVMRKGKIIGVMSPEAQQGARTLRMTFTKNDPTAEFTPLQGTIIEYFTEPQPYDAA